MTDDGPGDEDALMPQERMEATEDESGEIERCDYCRLPIPDEPITVAFDDIDYAFCCEACRTALSESDQVFTEYHGFRRLKTGVTALDTNLPQGIPRNSFVLVTDLAGTRTEAVQAELVWRALQRGEPVVFMSFLEPPMSVVQEFVTLSWNVLPSIEADNMALVDCFTYRTDDRDRMYDRMNSWNAHLWNVARDATVTVRDPTDVGQLQNRLDTALEAVGAGDEGLVVIDSLTELGSLVQPVQAYRFVKDVRADVSKGRFVPVFAGATMSGENEQFPHDLGYMVDGIVEMRLNEEIVPDALIKQMRVRKMSGVLTYPEWQVYECTAGVGTVTFDPLAEMRDDDEQSDGTDGDGQSDVAGDEDSTRDEDENATDRTAEE